MTQTINLNNLKADIFNGNAILFVGAGVSMGAGLPGWIDLARQMASEVKFRLPTESEDITAQHLLAAFQRYENENGRPRLIQKTRSALDTTRIDPTSVHMALTSLPIKTIFTTNYDNLIEEAFRKERKRRDLIVSESQLALWNEDVTKIVKLCGDIEQPDSVLITATDFNAFSDKRPNMLARLRNDLVSKTALFIGYSLQDPFFNQIWDRIGFSFGKMQRPAYAIMFDADENVISDLKTRNISVINIKNAPNKNTALTNLLKSFIEVEQTNVQSGTMQSSSKNTDSKTLPIETPNTGDQKNSMPSQKFSNDLQVKLRELMMKNFNFDEIKVLCQDIEVDFDNITGSNKETKILELIKYVERRSELGELIRAVSKARPKVDWLTELGHESATYIHTVVVTPTSSEPNVAVSTNTTQDQTTRPSKENPLREQMKDDEQQPPPKNEDLVTLLQREGAATITKLNGGVKILFAAANPTDTAKLRLGKEFDEIKDVLSKGKDRDKVELVLPQLATRARDLSGALLDQSPNILHFSGHGEKNGAIYFETDSGSSIAVSAEALALLFEALEGQVQCVILNACFSAVQAEAISKYIPYLIGMNRAIPDRLAIAFSIGFYQALASGRSIEQSFKFGKSQIKMAGG